MSAIDEIGASYQPPLDQLLTLGQPKRHGTEVDYAKLGIGREHVPELIRMATDQALNSGPSDSKLVWAPVHAWWALAQLRAEEAVVPLLGLLPRIDANQDDWIGEDMPRVLAAIGPSAIEPVTAYLADTTHDDWARVAAAITLGRVGQAHPETRAECVARLNRATGAVRRAIGHPQRLSGFPVAGFAGGGSSYGHGRSFRCRPSGRNGAGRLGRRADRTRPEDAARTCAEAERVHQVWRAVAVCLGSQTHDGQSTRATPARWGDGDRAPRAEGGAQ